MRALRSVPVLLVGVAAVASFATPAAAHAAYKSSDPPDDGQVSSPPGEVTATFTEPLAEGSYLQITDPCGVRVDEGDVRIVGYDMSVSMSGAAAGRYTVRYRAFSTLDPHVTEGDFGFTATSGDACAGEEGPSGPAAPPEESAGGGGMGPGRTTDSSVDAGRTDSGSVQGASARDPRDASGRGEEGTRSRGRSGSRGGAAEDPDEADLAASEREEDEAASVWDGIRLEPFLTGLLLAAIIGAAGGKMYAGIMGPRA